MNVVALDPSLTGTGVVVNGNASTITTKLKDESRLDFILAKIILEMPDDPDLVIIEGLAFGTQTGKAMERAGLHFMVRHALWQRRIPFAICPPTVLKRYITGKGNAAKDEVMIAAVRSMPAIAITNNNEADAAVMYALATDRLGSPILDVPKANRTMLDKVAWPEGV